MTNAELIEALRCCASTTNIVDECERMYCGYNCELPTCIDKMMRDAAAAIEAAEKRIAEMEKNFSDVCNANGSLACERNELLNDVRKLEAQLQKEGEQWN